MNAAKDIKTSLSLNEALTDADLVMEAGPEDIAVKRDLFKQMDELTPANTILATTSSSIPVSRLLPSTDKDKQCLNLHFYFPTIVTNMVDVTGSPATRAEVMDAAVKWAISLGCVPLEQKIKRGEPGVKTHRGFYTYPNPEYSNPDFCNPEPNRPIVD